MLIIKLKNISTFNTFKFVTWIFVFLLTRIKNYLFYHVFTCDTLLHAHVYNNENKKKLSFVLLNISHLL